MKIPKVAIVGRPNVGKSTLFNRLCGRKRAFVDKEPGTTRDRVYCEAEWRKKHFLLIDTGGIGAGVSGLSEMVKAQAEFAVEEADLVILLLDAKSGPLPEDIALLEHLRRQKKDTIVAVNKKDSPPYTQSELSDFFCFGRDFVPISSLHGLNIDTLLDELADRIEPTKAEESSADVKIAIVGRPNVGKSSILNRITEKERSLVTDIPGTTTDAVDEIFEFENKRFMLIDTAGIRKRITSKIEAACVAQAVRKMAEAHIVWLIISADEGFTRTDKRIAKEAEKKGACSIIVVNKWDLAKGLSQREYEAHLSDKSLLYPNILFTSAVTGYGIKELLHKTVKLYSTYTEKIKTSKLNKVVSSIVERNSPPAVKGKCLKIYYATQTSTAPPTFTFWVNNPDLARPNWIFYLKKSLAESLGLTSVPVKVFLRRA
jgi:GTP-binding protein